jgi:erythromycin esterase
MNWHQIAMALALGWALPANGLVPVADDPVRAVRAATPEEEKAAIAWIAAYGTRFNPDVLTQAELAPIVARLSGARVIGVGEATHGTHQDQAFKAELIKALVRAGAIDTLAIECNRDAAAGFDHYVRTGEGDPVALVRSTSFFRIWKGDEFAGLLLWLRAWNVQSENPVGVIGIDNQDAGRDSAFALADLAKRDAAIAAAIRAELAPMLPADGKTWRHFYRWLSGAPKADFTRSYAAVTRLKDWYEGQGNRLDEDPGFVAARHAARIAWQGFNQNELENGEADVSKLPAEYISRRDRFMAGNLIALLGPSRRAALWAHDGHIADSLSDADLRDGWLNLGTLIERRLGEDYRTVGFTWSRGQVLATPIGSWVTTEITKVAKDEAIPLRNDRPGELGSIFDRASGGARAMWAPIREARGTPALDGWRKSDYWRGHLGWGVDPAKWQPPAGRGGYPAGEGFDILVWFATVSPQRRWPNVPSPQ